MFNFKKVGVIFVNTNEKIKSMRKKLGINADTLAEQLGISKATLYRYERGDIKKIPSKIIEKIAKIMNVSVLVFSDSTESFSLSKQIHIPIVGKVSAGVGSLAQQYIEGYETASSSDINSQSQYIYLKVTGDSMYPMFMEGDLVLIECCPCADSGSFAVVIVDDCDGVIKKIIYGKNYIELISINPMYPPRRFEDKDMERIRVCGVVKEIKRKL